jgi:Ca-activated chloride channel family protein
MMMQIVHPWVVVIGAALVIACAVYRWFWYTSVRYVTPYTQLVARLSASTSSFFSLKKILFFMRLLALILLVVATAQLRMIDETSKVEVQGSDIMLVLDVSGSMQLFDDVQDQRSRFDVAKQEVLNFIDGRFSDSLGFIIF